MADRVAGDLGALASRLMAVQGGRTAWIVALTVGNMAAQGATVALLIPLLRVAGVPVAGGTLGTIDRAIGGMFAAVGLAPALPAVLAAFIAAAWLQALLDHMELVGTARLEQELVRDLRQTLYRELLAARWRFFTARRTTDVTHAVTRDTDRAGAAVGYLVRAAAQLASVAIYGALAVAISPAASAVALAGGLLLALSLRATLRSAHATGEATSRASADALALVTQHVDAIKLVKSYGAEERTLRAFAGVADRSAESAVQATRAHARAHVATIAGSATVLGVVLYVAVRVLHLDAAAVLVLTFLFWRLVPRLMDVQQSVRFAVHELPGFTIVRRLLDEAAAARESPASGVAAAAAAPAAIRSAVTFDRVSFAYDAAPVLRDCTCEIAAGRITAFTGASGAGKTTVVDLLLGLLTPVAGVIRVDGRPLTADWLPAWRSTVAYVPQEPLLFHDTILANLRWANPAATMPDIWEALTAAAADDFVRRLSAGVDTVVGDRGVRVSGGERQRLALARALLRKPVLLVLDEATNAIDAESEARILRAIVALRGTVTTVLVSHRPAPLACADTVYSIGDAEMRAQVSGAL